MIRQMRSVAGGLVVLACLLASSLALGQEPPPPPDEGRGPGARGEPPPPPPDGRGPGARGENPPPSPEQRILSQLQYLLGASDDEWAVLQPRVARVQTLVQQRERLLKPRPPKPPRPVDPNRPDAGRGPQDEGPQSPLTDLKSDPNKDAPANTINGEWMRIYTRLAMLAGNGNATEAHLRVTITELRAAREKSDAELAKARADLRQLLTTAQEAVLIVMGFLD
jgi:hypothetical protein